ncbi:MAG: penicillin-binding protein 2 [Candidatus Saccharibacteria bacterium]|nr:penicillin-binding protein 2 [Candidatus Saccharibacteria bacterium]
MQRIKILKKIVFVAFAIIVVRLFFVQIIEHDVWLEKAKKQHTILETIVARRGQIYMMDHNEPVAVVLNQAVYSIIIDPSIVELDTLKELLHKHADDYIVADLDRVYSVEGLRYYVVARNVPRAVALEIAKTETAGIWFQKNNQRVYPEGEMASGLLGFVNMDGVGQYGVEGSLNSLLAGSDGLLKTVADVNSVALSIGDDNVKTPAKDGEDIVLSVDRGLEQGIEELALSALNSTAATNAAVLVMDPRSGEVLAMGNLPNYDPSNYGYVNNASAYINYVTESPYEPASTFKSFTYSAAINEGVMTAETEYFNKHYEVIDGWTIWNASTNSFLYGPISMKRAFAWSLNSGSIYALKLLGGNPNQITKEGREKLYDYYYNKFRFGQLTGIEIAEAKGYIEDPNEGWGRDSTYANMTFGQNLGVTMIQAATAFSAVVNGGYYHTPTIVKGILKNQQITEFEREEEVINEQIITSETSSAMRELLINNRSAQVRSGIDRAGYAIGGKTGTAQVVRNGAYDNTMSELVGSYIGFLGPSDELPRFVVMVRMWGEGQSIVSSDANNLFDLVASFIIDYCKIKPAM